MECHRSTFRQDRDEGLLDPSILSQLDFRVEKSVKRMAGWVFSPPIFCTRQVGNLPHMFLATRQAQRENECMGEPDASEKFTCSRFVLVLLHKAWIAGAIVL
jgi:hypothetical protein